MSNLWENSGAKIGALSLLSAGTLATTAFVLYSNYSSKPKKIESTDVNHNKIVFTKTPKRWVKVGEVSELIIYPIKSCKGVRVNEGRTTLLGLQGNSESTSALRDRVFMLVTADGKFRTQRNYPKMALIEPRVHLNSFILSAPGMADLELTVPQYKEELVRSCKCWKDEVKTCLDCGDEVGNWFSEYVGDAGLRLYFYYGDECQRNVLSESYQKKSPYFEITDKGTYQDETSYMMMTEESLVKLNEHLETPVTNNNFRPSVIIKGTPHPFAEDLWTFIKIGSGSVLGESGGRGGEGGTVFKTAVPCMRCKLTTVNPETGEFSPNGEPLSTIYKLKRDLGNDTYNKMCAKAAVLGNHFGLWCGGEDENKNKEAGEEDQSEGCKQRNNVIRVGDSVYAALL